MSQSETINTCECCPPGTACSPERYVCDGCGKVCCRIVRTLTRPSRALCNICEERRIDNYETFTGAERYLFDPALFYRPKGQPPVRGL
jgi:hypothetical protein